MLDGTDNLGREVILVQVQLRIQSDLTSHIETKVEVIEKIVDN